MTARPLTLTLTKKAVLLLRARLWLMIVSIAVRHQSLPQLVERLGRSPRRRRRQIDPQRLGRIVDRVLHTGPKRPRCLLASLVLFRLLRQQGTDAEVVIGLPPRPSDKSAHAWVEVGGVDVGPPPGRGEHVVLARYGSHSLTLRRSE